MLPDDTRREIGRPMGRGTPVRTSRATSAMYGAIALSAILGCRDNPPASGRSGPDGVAKPVATSLPVPDGTGKQRPEGAAAAKPAPAARSGQDGSGSHWTRPRCEPSRRAHRRQGNDARKVVFLGRPAGVREVPDYSQATRPDMLPREVRQAVLLAARDELGLATRDQVIDDTPADSKEPDDGIVEVVSFIRDNRSHEMIRRLEKERSETILAHETPTAPAATSTSSSCWRARALSRGEFPAVLKGMGLEGKPKAVKEDAGLPEKAEDRLSSMEFLDTLLAVRDVHATIRTMATLRLGWRHWCAATRCSASSANSIASGTSGIQ